jgi:hypothetical protein
VGYLISPLSTNFGHTQINPSRDGRTFKENRVDSRLAAISPCPSYLQAYCPSILDTTSD